MGILEFKEYLISQLNLLNDALKKIELEISSLPEINQFDPTKYGTKKELLQKYYANKPKRLININIPPSQKHLQEFIYHLVLTDLNKQKEQINIELNEITNALNAIDEKGNIKGEIYPLDHIIKNLISYCIANNLPPQTFLNLLSGLIKSITKDPNDVKKSILNDLTNYFDQNNNLIVANSNLVFIFEKLFALLGVDSETQSYQKYISYIYAYIKCKTNEKNLDKETLKAQKNALAELNNYIKNGQIISLPANLDAFTKLLKSANLPKEITREYQNTMQQAIVNKKKAEEDLKIKKALKYYLSKEDLDVLQKTKELIASSDDLELIALLSRLNEEILSLCKYLIFIHGTYEEHISVEILFQKISSLRIIIKNYQSPQTKIQNSFYYLTDQYHLPAILNSLETIDITLYEEISNLLIELAHNRVKGHKIKEESGIAIYSLIGSGIKIIYTQKEDEIVIASITSKLSTNDLDKMLSPNKLNAIKKIHSIPKTTQYKKLNALYESLVASQLDLRKESPELTFHPHN